MTIEEFEEATGKDLSSFSHLCHGAAVALVRSGFLGECRVARGSCPGVGGQHSWVVLGMDCYNKNADIVDPTLWSYDPTVPGIWTGKAHERPHTPLGARGNIFAWGRPAPAVEKPIELSREGLSRKASLFLDLLGPLDRHGWQVLLGIAPLDGWPAAEIIAAAYQDVRLAALIPIDIVGMLTDLNPMGLYLPGEEKVPVT